MTNDTHSMLAQAQEQEMPVSQVPWWKSSLFWRTFFLVGILLVISMGAWIYSFRLEQRGTDAPEVINDRIARAEYELSFAPKFDTVIINDNLEQAEAEAEARLKAFLDS